MSLFGKILKDALNPLKATVDRAIPSKSESQYNLDRLAAPTVNNVISSWEKMSQVDRDAKTKADPFSFFQYCQAKMFKAIRLDRNQTVQQAEGNYGHGYKFVNIFGSEAKSAGEVWKDVAPVVAATVVAGVSGGPLAAAGAFVGSGLANAKRVQGADFDKLNLAVNGSIKGKIDQDNAAAMADLQNGLGSIGSSPVVLIIGLLLVFLLLSKNKKRK